jgi:hypothetical protein
MKKFLFAILASVFALTVLSQGLESISVASYIVITNNDSVISYVVTTNDGKKHHLTFFNLGRSAYTQDVTESYGKLGLTPNALLQQRFNAANKTFSVNYPNVSFWIQDDGAMMYGKWFSPKGMVVDTIHPDDYWLKNWWFGGVPIQ